MFGPATEMEAVDGALIGALRLPLDLLPTILTPSPGRIQTTQALSLEMNSQLYLTSLQISIATVVLALGPIPSSLTMAGSAVSSISTPKLTMSARESLLTLLT